MDDVQLWRELGQQFRVDSVRCAAAAKSGHPTSGMSAADLMSVLLAEAPALRLRRAGRCHERPADLLQGPRVHAPVRDVPRRRRDLGRRDAHLPPVRLDARGAPDAADPVGRRRHRLARPGAADRGRDGDRRQVPRPAPVPGLGALRRQRDRRGLDLGGVRARLALRARQPDRDPRRQPARAARPDDGRVAARPLPRAGRGVRLARDRDRRPRRRGGRRRVHRGGGDDRGSRPS